MRPNVAELHRELQARGLSVETAQLGADVFNQLSLREPTGVALRMLEARSFSPPPVTPSRTLLGQFHSLSLPAADLERAGTFWRDLGATLTDTQQPWAGFSLGDQLPLGYHSRRDFPEAVLCFLHADLAEAQLELADAGLLPEKGIATLAGVDHLLLRSPEGQALLVLVC